jgi:hypothetical protein
VLVVTLPVGQAVQVEGEEAPVVVEYVLTPQSMHEKLICAPVTVEYFPAPQSMHVEDTDAPEVEEYLPASQSVHALVPMVCLYLPKTHAVHDPPSGPENPALHLQLVITVDPATD